MMSRRQQLRRITAAMGMASRIVLGLEYARTDGVCSIAACCGAAALRRLGVDAQPELVAVSLLSPQLSSCAGHSLESARAVSIERGVRPEEFSAEYATEPDPYPFHVAIRCRRGDAEGLLDLRLGQLDPNDEAHTHSWGWFEGRWFDGYGVGSNVYMRYQPSPHPEHVPKSVLEFRHTGFEDSLVELAQAALNLDVDTERFARYVMRHMLMTPKPGSELAAFGSVIVPEALRRTKQVHA